MHLDTDQRFISRKWCGTRRIISKMLSLFAITSGKEGCSSFYSFWINQQPVLKCLYHLLQTDVSLLCKEAIYLHLGFILSY